MVEYIRGSRVDDYAPLFDLNARLCAMNFRVSSTADGESCPDRLLWCTYAEEAFNKSLLHIQATSAIADPGCEANCRLGEAAREGYVIAPVSCMGWAQVAGYMQAAVQLLQACHALCCV